MSEYRPISLNTWKLLAQHHRIGEKNRLMASDFAVLVVMIALRLPLLLGSIGVRQYLSKIAAANGKSFICANVGHLGGDGVTNVPLMNLPVALQIARIKIPSLVKIAILTTIAFLATFRSLGDYLATTYNYKPPY